MAASLVQQASYATPASGTDTSVTLTFGSATNPSDALILMVMASAGMATPTGWRLDQSKTETAAGFTQYTFSKQAAGETSITFAVTSGQVAAVVEEWSGLALTSGFPVVGVQATYDLTASAATIPPAPADCQVTTTNTDDVVFFAASFTAGGHWFSSGLTSSFIEDVNLNGASTGGAEAPRLIAGHLVTTTAATYSTAATFNSPAFNVVCGLISYTQPAPAGLSIYTNVGGTATAANRYQNQAGTAVAVTTHTK